MRPLAIFVMGVSGSGKTTIGKLLSERTGIPFLDGDDFHPQSNIRKMASGIPLEDADRKDWLQRINRECQKYIAANRSVIMACSALKQQYRTILAREIQENVKFVFLNGDLQTIASRLTSRPGHFMPASLLNSQFSILENPENAIEVNITNSPEIIVQELEEQLMKKSDIGIIGLGVMGKSLCRNLAAKGFRVSMFNRYVKAKEENVAIDFKSEHEELKEALAFEDLKQFTESLQSPARILIMISAGKAVDLVVQELIPLLDKGSVLIDGGNSHYTDTNRRFQELVKYGIDFIGCGISGGEAGALSGPSLMPGGTNHAYLKVQAPLEAMAALDNHGKPCCSLIGPEGSGHFVKMVHNGIEYAEMQLLAELYHLHKSAGLNNAEIATLLKTKLSSEHNSYLLEITLKILNHKEGNHFLLDLILDKASNKGTGNWATIAASELGVPATMISEALFARYVSSLKAARIDLSNRIFPEKPKQDADLSSSYNGYKLARILNHVQGFELLRTASDQYNWNLNTAEIARIWTNGCIIRSDLMDTVTVTLKNEPRLLYAEDITNRIAEYKKSLQSTCKLGIDLQVPLPCHSAALNYLYGMTTKNLPANLIQAQRDYFGAHTYLRIDDPEQKPVHTLWY
ncbi:NADP-dependent phosphogluconate dehydrogenase [Robertkochia solimangrovi]|uniref:NADP-dependent phosphogluconate dehydrogenase n=1 Tax=Robertkochia solimangrovi TaxID=2213046 RepID=UPI0011808BFE|nr:NADP-dependent phosphogluconate dehydrogenase [Robertkochia solimangrovi]TRZ45389.1 phosphogluconate dehydrogenase (NADP(+)-dependent, decarboxylating) [Robertkochia solimangrovi]